MRRVVITGIGVVSPNGNTTEEFWDACVEGRSGVSRIDRFDTDGYPTTIGGQVKGFDVKPYVKNPKSLKVMGPNIKFAVGAAHQAAAFAGLSDDSLDPARFGVCMGSGVVPMELGELAPAIAACIDQDGEFDPQKFGTVGPNHLPPLWLLKQLPNMLSSHLAILHHAEGPCITVTTACAAGTQAIGEAFRLIARDDADVMLAGGSDSRLEPLMLVAYAALGALSRSQRPQHEVSRPFDRERDGFVLGEGSAVLVLEDYERAKRRGAKIYAEVRGYGSSCDAFGLTRPCPTGIGAARSMEGALREANLDRDDIDYINAHGTSTRLNDEMETMAVKRALGADAKRTPMSSIKSMIGHLIGAAGAVEAAATALTISEGVLPPTINLTNPDPTCDLDYIPNEARERPVNCALSNSFGFGGQNAAVILSAV
ncbi:3-oxoacyl-[acyl-carrier-protein] synthase 2 [Planctomycetes bacterium Pan216]|uniref:3-oxoacyl-[acyl-carrier-protein] synthase 2 n=1 Tax=Kolteria novifilia TaxID=2527975 RepID=A0A518AX80_9BACT|nr:3-oxoacyl-[acyl-carrier-protein] synthase 2 [Planctomycetes bacterium Pan216]